MKRNLNRLMGLLLTIALAIGLMAGMSITALADNTGAYNSYLVESNDTEDALQKEVVSMKKCEKTWSSQIVEHKGFKDLGNYVIELPDFDDPKVLEIVKS